MMRFSNFICVGVVAGFLTPVSGFGAEDQPKKIVHPVYLTAAEGGADYRDQGEYANDWGGAQVIALGNGEFLMVTYRGGLPGAGWDRDVRREVSGKREGSGVVFRGDDGYRAELNQGKITINTDQGGPYTMNKVERRSPTLGQRPPEGAQVLFGDSGADPGAWAGGHLSESGFLAAGCKSKSPFKDFKAHIEFLLPFKPTARGQARGNSGVYVQDRYELQVLDSFGLTGEDNECGGIYKQARPRENMCYPPLVWQTYDIEMVSARFAPDGARTERALLTVKHNGVLIHDKLVLSGPTPGGKPENELGGSLQLQGHGNPVVYRNIWVQEK